MLRELKIAKYLLPPPPPPPLPTCALISRYQGYAEKLKGECFNLGNNYPGCPAYDFCEKAKIF